MGLEGRLNTLLSDSLLYLVHECPEPLLVCCETGPDTFKLGAIPPTGIALPDMLPNFSRRSLCTHHGTRGAHRRAVSRGPDKERPGPKPKNAA